MPGRTWLRTPCSRTRGRVQHNGARQCTPAPTRQSPPRQPYDDIPCRNRCIRPRKAAPPVEVRALRKVYGDVAAVDGIELHLRPGRHGAARRQRRRQDHDHLHADGARGADLGRGARVRRRHGARAPQGAAPHELREPLRRRADAADRAAEPGGVRQALWRARPQGAHRRDRGGVEARRVCWTGPTASSPPARRRASASPRRCSTSPSCCCSTSRPPRSIPTRPTGCAPSSRTIASCHAATVVLASHNMAEVERLADRVIMLEKGRIIADETPRELIERFGRANLEEVFLAIARRGAEDAELRAVSAEIAHLICASRRRCRIGGAHLGHGAALLVRDPLVLAAHRRADLLAAGADADVGLPAELPGADRRASPPRPPACSSAACCCGTSWCAASSALPWRSWRRSGRATSAT